MSEQFPHETTALPVKKTTTEVWEVHKPPKKESNGWKIFMLGIIIGVFVAHYLYLLLSR